MPLLLRSWIMMSYHGVGYIKLFIESTTWRPSCDDDSDSDSELLKEWDHLNFWGDLDE